MSSPDPPLASPPTPPPRCGGPPPPLGAALCAPSSPTGRWPVSGRSSPLRPETTRAPVGAGRAVPPPEPRLGIPPAPPDKHRPPQRHPPPPRKPPPSAREGNHQGRDELRDQPTTRRWSGTNRTAPFGRRRPAPRSGLSAPFLPQSLAWGYPHPSFAWGHPQRRLKTLTLSVRGQPSGARGTARATRHQPVVRHRPGSPPGSGTTRAPTMGKIMMPGARPLAMRHSWDRAAPSVG
ncbi:hypothetical protein SCOCK_180005 [Actinacidiphila cocklensis]|uniref:Uncharacterized protein n=1 Tax=Actinacidiphila cocklensis TaxID=887465 RepID=A0A9W4DN24_9ACTN|nr:hypothetical protein SCOCK_180005 [Actinacidiphila cocklensis]